MILLDKLENQYPTHFWISAKPVKTGISGSNALKCSYNKR